MQKQITSLHFSPLLWSTVWPVDLPGIRNVALYGPKILLRLLVYHLASCFLMFCYHYGRPNAINLPQIAST